MINSCIYIDTCSNNDEVREKLHMANDNFFIAHQINDLVGSLLLPSQPQPHNSIEVSVMNEKAIFYAIETVTHATCLLSFCWDIHLALGRVQKCFANFYDYQHSASDEPHIKSINRQLISISTTAIHLESHLLHVLFLFLTFSCF